MKNITSLIACLIFVVGSLSAQMVVNGNTLYGNEWIDYGQQYFKVQTAENGVYRIPKAALPAALNNVAGANMQLFLNGEEVPIYVSTNGNLGNNDYIEFAGFRNKGEIDSHLFSDPAMQVNPWYSMVSDSSAFFLTYNNSGNNLRYDNVINDLNNPPAAEPYCMAETDFYHTVNSGFHPGRYVSVDLFDSKFNLGEGFAVAFGTTRTMPLSIGSVYTSGSVNTSTLITRGASDYADHDFELEIVNKGVVATNSFTSYKVNEYTVSVDNSFLTGTTRVRWKGVKSSADKHAPSYARLIYPHTFSFDNKNFFEFTLPAEAGARRYLEISNFNHGGTAPVLYDKTNNIRIATSLSGNSVRVVLPAANGDRDLVLVAAAGVQNISRVAAANFVNFSDSNFQGDYVIISNKRFIDDPLGHVQDYQAYRNSTGYDAVVIDVQQLYDQFAYGINRHGISIRNFTGYVKNSWNDTKYFFIIGKGRAYQNVRGTITTQPIYIPTFGHPPSDNLLTATVDSNVPRIPIGRLPVLASEEIEIYLRKVRAYELNQNTVTPVLDQTLDDKGWMKRIMHLGGGDPNIQSSIQSNLNTYKSIIENDNFGGQVTSFFKTSSDPIQISQSEYLDSLINTGLSLITFFGHSSTNSFDFSLDSPSSYENFERYPVMLSLGCFSGHIHQSTRNLGEDFVLTEDKGAIAFIASVALSGLGSLNSFATKFYQNLSIDNYGEGLGDVIQASIQDLANQNSNVQLINQQMTLDGDPALRMNVHLFPDYLVNGSTVTFDPEEVTANEDFKLDFRVTNIGRSVNDSFNIKIVRTLPNGNEIEIANKKFPTPKFERDYSFEVKAISESVGNNKFTITVDATELIVEGPAPQAENNNVYVINRFIFTDDINPIFPYDFSIVPEPNPVLKASISNIFAEELPYFIEIDTTERFNSPIKRAAVMTVPGGVLEWQPDIPYYDNTVYYWRVRIDPNAVQTSTGWKGYSFVYIQDEFPGWNQSHYYQYLYDRFQNIKLEGDREFSFIDDFKDINVFTGMVDAVDGDLTKIGYSLNNYVLHEAKGGNCTNGLYFAILDPFTVEPLVNIAQGGDIGLYNSYVCRSVDNVFLYNTTTESERQKAIDFLEGPDVRDSSYVVVFSMDDYEPSEWSGDATSLFETMQNELGATQIQSTAANLVPYIGVFRKNMPSFTAQEVLGDSLNELLDVTFSIQGSWSDGNILSTTIGPASEWFTMLWDRSALDGLGTNDEVSVDIIGITADGTETPLITEITNTNQNLTSIDADLYPKLRLQLNSADATNETASQLDYWRVVHRQLPDCAVRPDIRFALKDTVQQGEPLNFEIAIQNVSEGDMTALLFKYSIIDQNNQVTDFEERLAALPAGDTIYGNFVINTRNLEGDNRLIIEANPLGDQPEQYAFNNIGQTRFYVQKDIRNPLLDVTFDGQHILDGDIVSAKPKILVTLNDENNYIELGDTSLIEVRVLRPGESLPAKPVYFAGGEMEFFPADPNNLVSENRAYVEFTPTFEGDGEYQLFVLARDPSKNESGDLDYKVSFNVINKSSISNVLNYPNPFTSSTQFVFTLTGSELPDHLKIQIMTVTGKVVREITMDELGPLHIGHNRTEFAWDGTDEYGDKLANGVYLYRVITQGNNGADYESYQTNTNQYFKSGFGKMYLMR